MRGVGAMAPHVFVEELALEGIRAAFTAYADGGLRELMARHHNDPDLPFGGWSDLWLSPAFRDWDMTHLLGRIAAPALLVQGSEDEYGTLAQLDAIERGAAGPVRRLVTDGGALAPSRPSPCDSGGRPRVRQPLHWTGDGRERWPSG